MAAVVSHCTGVVRCGGTNQAAVRRRRERARNVTVTGRSTLQRAKRRVGARRVPLCRGCCQGHCVVRSLRLTPQHPSPLSPLGLLLLALHASNKKALDSPPARSLRQSVAGDLRWLRAPGHSNLCLRSRCATTQHAHVPALTLACVYSICCHTQGASLAPPAAERQRDPRGTTAAPQSPFPSSLGPAASAGARRTPGPTRAHTHGHTALRASGSMRSSVLASSSWTRMRMLARCCCS